MGVPRRLRVAAVLGGLALLAACGPQGGQVAPSEVVDSAREALGQAGPEADPGDAPAPADQSPEDPSAADDPQPPGDDAPPDAHEPLDTVPAAPPADPDRAALGAMCRTYLRGDVPRLVIEVDHQAGAAPQPAAIEHLVSVLRSVLDKPGGIEVVVTEIPGGAQTWTVSDLDVLSREHRTHTSDAQQAVMHVLSLRGEFEQRDALGVTFDASSFALFPDRIDGLATLLGGAAAVQRAVLTHEAGHLLCLLNITYESEIDHEDPDHPHHSSDRDSVMYWGVENAAIAQVFSGPPPADFTANDRADLQGLRMGRY